MGINISTGVPPPDDVNLAVSTSTNKLILKAGTRGDLFYMGASDWVKLAKGTSGQYLSIGANDPAWSDAPGEAWVFLQKLSPAAAATIDTSALPEYDQYLAIFKAYGSTSSGQRFYFQCGDGAIDTGANYTNILLNNATMSQESAQTYITICGVSTACIQSAKIIINGKTDATRTTVGATVNAQMETAGGKVGMGGQWAAGTSKVLDLLRFGVSSGTMTGTIEIFGRNVHA